MKKKQQSMFSYANQVVVENEEEYEMSMNRVGGKVTPEMFANKSNSKMNNPVDEGISLMLNENTPGNISVKGNAFNLSMKENSSLKSDNILQLKQIKNVNKSRASFSEEESESDTERVEENTGNKEMKVNNVSKGNNINY